MRQRLRSLLRFSTLVVLVRDDAESVWTVELAEGVRLGSRLVDRDLPKPLQRALTSMHPVLIADRIADPDEDGFAALGRSGMYMALRARGALVGLIALEDVPAHAYGPEQHDLLESLSSLLALSIDNARWFARLRTLGAEAERARIARELHDRVGTVARLCGLRARADALHPRREGRRDLGAARRRSRHRPASCARRSTSSVRT